DALHPALELDRCRSLAKLLFADHTGGRVSGDHVEQDEHAKDARAHLLPVRRPDAEPPPSSALFVAADHAAMLPRGAFRAYSSDVQCAAGVGSPPPTPAWPSS